MEKFVDGVGGGVVWVLLLVLVVEGFNLFKVGEDFSRFCFFSEGTKETRYHPFHCCSRRHLSFLIQFFCSVNLSPLPPPFHPIPTPNFAIKSFPFIPTPSPTTTTKNHSLNTRRFHLPNINLQQFFREWFFQSMEIR